MLQMKTNEEERAISDRRIPLNWKDILKEFLGNMKGNVQKIFYEGDKIIFYNNDEGFTENDKKALFVKNQSGDNINTAGLNGFGCRLSIDRILPPDTFSYATVYSINDKYKCKIGHFCYTNWEKINDKDIVIIKKYINEEKVGSLFIIPLDSEWSRDFDSQKENLLNISLKCLNVKLNENNLKFCWNGESKTITKYCPDEGSITLYYSLGHDSDNNNNATKKLYIKINNHSDLLNEDKSIIPELCHISRNTTKLENASVSNFTEIESGMIKLNVVKENDKYSELKVSEIDGLQVYIKDININHKAIIKNLGARSESGVFGKDTYDGKPRFENHISKNSGQYQLPSDKSNVRPTNKGESVLKYIGIISKKKWPKREKINNELNDIVNDIVNDTENNELNDIVNDIVNDTENNELNDIVNNTENNELNDIVNDTVNEEINKKNDRCNFSESTKRLSIEKQPRCPLTGLENDHREGVMLFDFDHNDGNKHNNSQENCSPLSLIAHRLKTKNLDKYKKIMINQVEIINFRLDLIDQIINGLKESNILDNNIKMKVLNMLDL